MNKATSPRAKRRVQILMIVAFATLAITNWWLVIDEGPSTARVLAAIISTAIVIVTRFRKPPERFAARRRTAEGSDGREAGPGEGPND